MSAINMSQTFESFLQSQGFRIDKPLVAGAGIHRYSNDKKRNKSCWAVLFPDAEAGVWGDWRESNSHYWRLDGRDRKQLSKAELEDMERKRALAEKMREDELDRLAVINLVSWNALEEGIECQYLAAKKVAAHGIKIGIDGNAYVPARDIEGKFWNYQNISSSPKLWRRGRSKGLFHVIEGNCDQIIICSGYATGASIHEATGLCVVVCFGDGNIPVVLKILKDAKWKSLVVAADNDCDGSKSGNRIAKKVSNELGILAVIPDHHGDFNDLACSGENIYRYFYDTTPVFSFGHLINDNAPMPEDIIYPRVLTEGGMLVFGGAPKVGKSDFMLSWLVHMAAGEPFMGMRPSKPLKIFYLQSEVQYDYLRERVKAIDIDKTLLGEVSRNLFLTPQLRILLDENGVRTVGNTIRQCFGLDVPDIICIDPISNVYDQESENDNAQMMKFLSQRVEGLREYASPKTGLMLIHHTKKIAREEVAKDPFLMFSGASSLRRYYTTGMLIYRPDEEVSECVLTYEVRNGPRVPNINIDKDMGRWMIIPKERTRIGKHDIDKQLDDDRKRKVDILVQELQFEMERGNNHTLRSFSDYMGGKSGLGSSITINRLLGEMMAQGTIYYDPNQDGKRRFIIA